MREPRNPFRMRASEQIESDPTFLKMFGPGVLDLLPSESLWSKIQLFRSAPGGGKTTLFRVFTPSSLQTLFGHRENEDHKDLFNKLADLDVFSETGPNLLGVMLTCALNYATLDDLNIEEARKDRLLFSLFDSRILIASLREAVALLGLDFPQGLNRFTIKQPKNKNINFPMPILSTGSELYDWACELEKNVCEAIDSFDPENERYGKGHSTLFAPHLISPENFLFDGEPFVKRIILMLDDFHTMSDRQANAIWTTIVQQRPTIPVWIAERLQAVDPPALLGLAGTRGREYEKPIVLEEFWRKNSGKFKKLATDISERRAKVARDVQIGSFISCLQDEANLGTPTFAARYATAINEISNRATQDYGNVVRYREWIRHALEFRGSERHKAIQLKIQEILISRDQRKTQQSFNFSLPPDDLEQKENSRLRGAADYFLSREYKIPYYFGANSLATLASSNIEQYLMFAGELFEEIISAELLGKSTALDPEKQEKILKKATTQIWADIVRLPNGKHIQEFIESIANFCLEESLKPNAPYAPGVTGIGISSEARNTFYDITTGDLNPNFKDLGLILSTAIFSNLLEIEPNVSQGRPGEKWTIFYLNRWLCLHFGLPLNYGGYRHKSLIDLNRWLSQGYKWVKQEGFA
jgi:hypothetical protein